MKIILTESNPSESLALNQILSSWGFEVFIRSTEYSIISTLKAFAGEIRIVIINSSEIALESLIKRARKDAHYTYFIYLTSGNENNSVFDTLEKPDIIVQKPVDLGLFRIKLFGARKAIELTLSHPISYQARHSNFCRQILNLETLDQHFSHRKATLKADLALLIQELKTIELSDYFKDVDYWISLLVRSDELGCEHLSDWIAGVLFINEHRSLASCISFSLLQYRLTEVRKCIEMGVSSLTECRYFEDSKTRNPINVLEGKQILLVEDMQYNRALLQKILAKQNGVIYEATNGEDALEIWQRLPKVDIIIMDMNMPVMDGFLATKKIREIEHKKHLKRTPIIALTALAMRGDKEMCLEAGTDDYLPKPVETQSLLKVCRRLLAKEETLETKYREYIPELSIRNVLLRSYNQISLFMLGFVFETVGIEYKVINDIKTLLNEVAQERFDLIILEAATDLELAYFIKNNFKHQQIALISTQNGIEEFIPKKKTDSFTFPFVFEQSLAVLEFFSNKIKQEEKNAEQLADAASLGKINRQVSIAEAVQKSDKQLAVWQKAFRKIGGDLVISHQFNVHGKFGLILGDVAGHDIQSGYTASWFCGLVEGIWGQFSNPYKFLINLNNRFAHDTEEENKRFVCSLILLWDPLREKLHYANSGIPGGILIKRKTGKSESMDWRGVPIGMFQDMDMYDHGIIDFTSGDKLIVATDGVLEAIPREIISGLSESSADKSAEQTLAAIVDFVSRSIEITDDLTIVVFEAKIPKLPHIGFRKTIKSSFKEVDKVVTEMNEIVTIHAPDRFDWPMISVAIREAVLNAVEHGNRNDVHLPVDIDFEILTDRIVVSVSDCGSGFDLAIEKKRLAKEGDLRIHGRGIEMMENISTSVSYLGGGIRLEFAEKSLNR